MNFKKVILLAMISGCAMTSIAYANPYVFEKNYAYLGANIDYLWITFDQTIQQRNPPGARQPAKDKQQGFTYGVDAGYSWIKSKFVYRLELTYDYDDISHEKYGTTTNTRMTMRDDFGLQFHFGRLITQRLELMALAGINYGRFHYTATGSRNNVSNYYDSPGYTVGGGLEYAITQHWLTRLNYEFSQFQLQKNISRDSGFYDRQGGAYTNEVAIAVAYAF